MLFVHNNDSQKHLWMLKARMPPSDFKRRILKYVLISRYFSALVGMFIFEYFKYFEVKNMADCKS